VMDYLFLPKQKALELIAEKGPSAAHGASPVSAVPAARWLRTAKVIAISLLGMSIPSALMAQNVLEPSGAIYPTATVSAIAGRPEMNALQYFPRIRSPEVFKDLFQKVDSLVNPYDLERWLQGMFGEVPLSHIFKTYGNITEKKLSPLIVAAARYVHYQATGELIPLFVPQDGLAGKEYFQAIFEATDWEHIRDTTVMFEIGHLEWNPTTVFPQIQGARIYFPRRNRVIRVMDYTGGQGRLFILDHRPLIVPLNGAYLIEFYDVRLFDPTPSKLVDIISRNTLPAITSIAREQKKEILLVMAHQGTQEGTNKKFKAPQQPLATDEMSPVFMEPLKQLPPVFPPLVSAQDIPRGDIFIPDSLSNGKKQDTVIQRVGKKMKKAGVWVSRIFQEQQKPSIRVNSFVPLLLFLDPTLMALIGVAFITICMLAGRLSRKNRAKEPPDLRKPFRVSRKLKKPMSRWQEARAGRMMRKAIRTIGLENIKKMSPEEFGRRMADHFGIGFIDMADERSYDKMKGLLEDAGIYSQGEWAESERGSGNMISRKDRAAYPSGRYPRDVYDPWVNRLLDQGEHHAYIFLNRAQTKRTGLAVHAIVIHEIAEYLVAEKGRVDRDFRDYYLHNNVFVLEQESDFFRRMGIMEEAFRYESILPEELRSCYLTVYGKGSPEANAIRKYIAYRDEKNAFFEKVYGRALEQGRSSSPIRLCFADWSVRAVPGRQPVPMKDPIEVAFISVEEDPVLEKTEYLFWRPRSFLEHFRNFMDKFFSALRRLLGKVEFVLGGVKDEIISQDRQYETLCRYAPQNDRASHVGAVVAASSSPVNYDSLNDDIWLGYFEQHPDKAADLIKEVIRQDNLAALAVIQGNQPQYPQLNLLIEQNLKQVVLK
ncbi:MAG TPA: hypothetical protein PKV41_05390, partial [Candidatus Omnitrophota bacterium]|nr:hypothetical protein [Candidatus Omnitrophota bacterium]